MKYQIYAHIVLRTARLDPLDGILLYLYDLKSTFRKVKGDVRTYILENKITLVQGKL